MNNTIKEQSLSQPIKFKKSATQLFSESMKSLLEQSSSDESSDIEHLPNIIVIKSIDELSPRLVNKK